MDMTTNTLERPTSEQVSQLSRADLEWLDSIGSFLLPAQELSVDVAAEAPDQLYFLDFSPVDNPSVLSGPKPKEKVTDLAYTETYQPKWLSPERRRRLGENLCHWAGFEPLSSEALEKAEARDAERRAAVINNPGLFDADPVSELLAAVPQILRKTGTKAALTTTLLATVLAGSNVAPTPEKAQEIELQAENLPELIFSHERIKVSETVSDNQAVRMFVAEAEKADNTASDVSNTLVKPAKKKLLETIVEIADKGNTITLSPKEAPEQVDEQAVSEPTLETDAATALETSSEIPVPDNGLHINVEFASQAASGQITELITQSQAQLDITILEVDQTGMVLVTGEPVAEIVSEPEAPLEPVFSPEQQAIMGGGINKLTSLMAQQVLDRDINIQNSKNDRVRRSVEAAIDDGRTFLYDVGNEGKKEVVVNPLVLKTLLDLHEAGIDFSFNSLTTCTCHKPNSDHYAGNAGDLGFTNQTDRKAAKEFLRNQPFVKQVIDEGSHVHFAYYEPNNEQLREMYGVVVVEEPLETVEEPKATHTHEPSASANEAPKPSSDVTVWDRLAACESGGDWGINTGNGYYGGVQFSRSSWEGVGGTGLPSDASKEEQIARAEMLKEAQGWGAWPSCSSKLNLR